MRNLYVHFPFCRRKCEYCALYSRTGVSVEERANYVGAVARAIAALPPGEALTTVYFGGGSPALCELAPLWAALGPRLAPDCEFTVELHPHDVTEAKLAELRSLGVNRISMGVQSLDDAILARMGRGYTADDAAKAFALVRRHFDNAGIDLIAGYEEKEEGKRKNEEVRLSSLSSWGLRHCSVYALQNERGLEHVADDETAMDELKAAERALAAMGLGRYEISNYALPGYECRHNLAVWRGEDYAGIGAGACGRVGLARTLGIATPKGPDPFATKVTHVTPQSDAAERTIFRLRTREGLSAVGHPEWQSSLAAFVAEGLLVRKDDTYFLTDRGSEVCDTILAELV